MSLVRFMVLNNDALKHFAPFAPSGWDETSKFFNVEACPPPCIGCPAIVVIDSKGSAHPCYKAEEPAFI